jgi:hypothetical protein
MPTCFVIMPIATPPEAVERYGGDGSHFVHVLEHLFVPAIEKAGYEAIEPSAQGGDLIQAEIVRNLETADVVLCDISGLNPNVFFELGIRTALDRTTCIVRDEHTQRIPFDTGIINTHTYRAGLHPWQLEAEIEALSTHLTTTAQRAEGRNALWGYFGLTQRGTDAADAVGGDPQQAKLQLILDEVQQLRRSAADTEAAQPDSAVRDPADRARSFLKRANSFAGGPLAVVRIDDHEIVLVPNRTLSEAQADYLRQIGMDYGFAVTFAFRGDEP